MHDKSFKDAEPIRDKTSDLTAFFVPVDFRELTRIITVIRYSRQ